MTRGREKGMPFKPTCSALEVSRVMDKQYGSKWGEGYNFKNKEKSESPAYHGKCDLERDRGKGKGKTQRIGYI